MPAVIAFLAGLVGVVINSLVIHRYRHMSSAVREKNSVYLLFCQAIVDLYNCLLSGPFASTELLLHGIYGERVHTMIPYCNYLIMVKGKFFLSI